MQFEMEFTEEEILAVFNKPVPPTPSPKTQGHMIVVKLSSNQQMVINLCKAALVREFGAAAAAKYIAYREESDERALQYWLQYQIERTAYPDTYTLCTACQRWLAASA
jgi:hypothetical protein